MESPALAKMTSCRFKTIVSPVTLNNASDYRAIGYYQIISDGLTG